MMHNRSHRIQPGENLTTIADRYGLPGWHSLYYADVNTAFRKSNPDPDKIYPGQVIAIPQTNEQMRSLLGARLERLKKARRESQELFLRQYNELQANFQAVARTATQVDTTATVALVLVSLTKTTLEGARIMKLEGAEATAAVNKFGAEALKDRGKNVRDAAAQAVANWKSESSSTVWLITKSVAQAWCDLTSPSFWANSVVNLYDGKSWSEAVTDRPEDVLKRSVLSLRSTQNRVMSDLDGKIREVEKELAALSPRPLGKP